MENTHQLSVQLENLFRAKIKEDFSIHCAGDFDGKNLYDAIIFWTGVRIGTFIANNNLPVGTSTISHIKDGFSTLQGDLENFKGKSWEELGEEEREALIKKVSLYINSF